jgi:very-short-patch-repair endonuclease
MDGPFLGIEALREGRVRKHELRSKYTAMFPGVYIARDVEPGFRERAEAAWLWSGRNGVLRGLTAARLHGAKWVDDVEPIELVCAIVRPPAGIRCVQESLLAGECGVRAGQPVTTVVRTAFDIGRRGKLNEAVARLDALGNATGLRTDDVAVLAEQHLGMRGVRQLRRALDLYDAGAQSPKETWLRMLVMRAGFPRPRTQIPVARYYLDMGWEDIKLALEYDGDHHRTDRAQFARDITRLEELADLGWTIVRVAADTPPHAVIVRLRRAWDSSSLHSDR